MPSTFTQLIALTLLLVLSGSSVLAAPRVPTSDAEVLERLPFKPNDPVARELSRLRAQLQRDPRNQDVAARLARRYYEMVAEEGDPRYLGYAQAALAPWWEMPTPPVEIQAVRASILQFRHDFDGAIKDLTQAIDRDPKNAQALSLRAIIHIVQARYALARIDCQSLAKVGDPLIGLGCESMVDGLTGNAEGGYQALSTALAAQPNIDASKKMWLLIRLAELAQRLDRPQVAERHYKEAVSLGITDTFLLAAYADLLLSENRPAEVEALLKDRTRSDTLLLRLVFAERALKLPTAKEREAALAARYEAAQMRGDTVHQQEEARFALHVQGDPQKSLKLAQENWKVQREPRDAQIYLEAALAAKEPAAAQPVLKWLAENHIQDRYMRSLAQQLTRAAQ